MRSWQEAALALAGSAVITGGATSVARAGDLRVELAEGWFLQSSAQGSSPGEAFRLAGHKLPIGTKFLSREG